MSINLSKNNLKLLFPNLAKEWHPTKNGNLRPENITKGSGKEVCWLCPKGHEYYAQICARTGKNNNNCPYCSGRRVSKENNLKFNYPNIASEWHPTKNGNLKPENVTKISATKVWWICPKGHEWQTRVSHRTYGKSMCPYCSNQKVSEDNNLKIKFPLLVKEWHPTKNGNLKPEDVVYGSSKKVWWLCIKGHEWATAVSNRTKTKGSNCPKCSNQSSKPEFRILSEIESIFKQVISRFKFQNIEIDIYIKDINIGIEYDGSYFHNDKIDLKKNKFLEIKLKKLIRVRETPLKKISDLDIIVSKNEITKKDLNKIFKCIYIFCDTEQKILIDNYINEKYFVNEKVYKKYLSYFPAPIPVQSLSLQYPQIAKEWNFNKNYPLTPESFSGKSGQKVWWLCPNGHEYETVIAARTRYKGIGCPYCYGRYPTIEKNLKILSPHLIKEFHPTRNLDLKMENLTQKSGKKVWWLCDKGHEWQTRVSHRANGSNCPFCSGRKVTKISNLKSQIPNISNDWHPTKNGLLRPEDVSRGTNKKVWWLCSRGHEGQQMIYNRVIKGCTECSNIKRLSTNNLKISFPSIAKEWHPTKNGNLKPEEVYKSASTRVMWLCPKGHDFIQSIINRVYNDINCPECKKINRKISKSKS